MTTPGSRGLVAPRAVVDGYVRATRTLGAAEVARRVGMHHSTLARLMAQMRVSRGILALAERELPRVLEDIAAQGATAA